MTCRISVLVACWACFCDGRILLRVAHSEHTPKSGQPKSIEKDTSEYGDGHLDIGGPRKSIKALGLLTLALFNTPRTFRPIMMESSIGRVGSGTAALVARRRISSLMVAADESPKGVNGAAKLPPIPPLLANRSNTAAIWRVAWPSIAIGLLRTALGQVDAWYIGRMGTAQLEAISAATFAIWLIYISGELPALSVQALSSASEGAGDRADGVGTAVVQGLWFSVVASLLIAVTALKPDLLRFYFQAVGVQDDAVVQAGIAYARATALWGAFPLAASNVASAGFKGIGETVPALWIAGATVLLNCLLNGPFIARWGVAGAAYATNLAVTASCLLSLSKLRRRGVRLRVVPPSLKILKRIARIGAPIASSGVLFTFVYMVLTRSITSISPRYVAALGLGHRIEAIAYTICEGFAIGTSAVVGQWAGSRRPASARKAAGAAARVSAAFMVPIGALLWIMAEHAARIFSQDALVVTATVSYLRIVSVIFPMMALEHVYEGALTGIQQTLPVFLLGLIFTLSRIPLARWLSGFWGVEGIWAAIAITTLLKAPAKWACFRNAPIYLVSLVSNETAT